MTPRSAALSSKPKEGYIEKLDRSGWFKRWQRRYFVLRGDTLEWFVVARFWV